jgi:hypothetical protein
LGRNPAQLREYLDDTATSRGQRYTLDWDQYLRLFQNVGDETAIGEASVDYFWLPSAAQAIRLKVPRARLIFVLRHPVEKLASSFFVALRRDPQLIFRQWFLAATRPGSAFWPIVDGARYATHLERFLGLFPRDQIRIYLYEAYRSDARAVVRDIFAFLGVDPNHQIDVSRRHHEGVVPRSAVLHRLRRHLLGDRTPTRPLPEALRRIVSRLYYRPRGDSALDPEDRRVVIDYYRDEIARTADMIGRDLSGWLR